MDGNVVWKIIGWQGSGALCVCVCEFIYLLISILHLDCLSHAETVSERESL